MTYELRGKPEPLEVINGVLVEDERGQRRVEKYLKGLYEFPSGKDYQNFLEGFIIRDNGTDSKTKSKNKDKKGKSFKRRYRESS